MSKYYVDKDVARRIASRIYSLIIAANQPITAEKDKNLSKLESEIGNLYVDLDKAPNTQSTESSSDETKLVDELAIVTKNIDMLKNQIGNILGNDNEISKRLNEIELNVDDKLSKSDNTIAINNLDARIKTLKDELDKLKTSIPEVKEFESEDDEDNDKIVAKVITDYDGNEFTVGEFNDLVRKVNVLEAKLDSQNHISSLHENETESGICFNTYQGHEKLQNGYELHYSSCRIPTRKHIGDSGWDAYACFPDEYPDEEKVIHPGKTELISLGIIVYIPEGYELQVRPRSGLSSKGIVVAFGTVDSSYRGVIKASVYNSTKEPFTVHQGDRICQLVPVKTADIYGFTTSFDTPNETGIDIIDQRDNDLKKERGANGFGSTGV